MGRQTHYRLMAIGEKRWWSFGGGLIGLAGANYFMYWAMVGLDAGEPWQFLAWVNFMVSAWWMWKSTDR